MNLNSSVDESQLELVRYTVQELGDTHFIIGRLARPHHLDR